MEKERDLSFEINTAVDLNKMLTGAIMDVRRGNLEPEMVKGITLLADKINKNNVNILQYKALCKHKQKIAFFEGEEDK
jgi:hypothetical protein